MSDRAYLKGLKADGTYKRCAFPCQRRIGIECSVPIQPGPGIEFVWTLAGGTPEAPMLTPSINCENDTCWHGHITNGDVLNPAPRKRT